MIIKVLKAIAGLVIMPFCIRVFRPEKVFRDKRVAVVGAASSILSSPNGEYIDTFDIVIRINKALITWNNNTDQYTGRKVDMLFHSFYENEERGGAGKLDLQLFTKRNAQFLVQPRNNTEGLRIIYNFFKKYRKFHKVYILPRVFYKFLNSKFSGLKPTIGYCALHTALMSRCNEVFITGFTFFKTPYAKGYRDNLISLEENARHIKKQGQHSPEVEFKNFQDLLKLRKSKKIIVDTDLEKILSSCEVDTSEIIVK